MKKSLKLLSAAMISLSLVSLASCNPSEKLEGTAAIVAQASKMSFEQLKEASKKEMEESDTPFSIIGLTSALGKAAQVMSDTYEWIHYDEEGFENNITENHSYKDYQLLTALQNAETGYVADYALVQDERSMADYLEGGLLHNYVPSDWKELGLAEEDTYPLKGIHFNKVFWTNTNFEEVTGKKLYNIWQVAGSESDPDHLSKVSFQTPVTEQINMSFLLSCYAEKEQARIKTAYKNYYGKEWAPSGEYTSAGEQWVTEFIANISRWHSSDGTAMKETQLKDDWDAGFVYYGAFAKMKDAVGKSYEVDINGDGVKETVNAMSTVKWDWQIDGFNGFMYTMDSQIINNAKHPYTACLYARTLCTLDCYKAMIYNNSLPSNADNFDYTWTKDSKGAEKVNQYGYYFPASNDITYAKGDWDKATHFQREIVEDYSFLKSIKQAQVSSILTLCTSNKKA